MKRGTAFDCSLRVLSLRDHAEAELRRKLKEKGYDPDESEGALERLRGLGYLDDLRFARSFASSMVRNGRGFGSRIRQELAGRGVSPQIVDLVLIELGEEYDENAQLDLLMERRFAGFDPNSTNEKERRRIIGYLQRKGFSLGAILARLRQ